MKCFSTVILPLLYLGPVYADYLDNAYDAFNTIQNKWYNSDTGLWYATFIISTPFQSNLPSGMMNGGNQQTLFKA